MLSNLSFAQSNDERNAARQSMNCGTTPEFIKRNADRNKNLAKWVVPPITNDALLRGEAACSKVQSTKFIKLHFHYILKNDGTGNFRATDDGYVGTAFHQAGVTGNTFAADVITNANGKMAYNYRNYLPQSLSNITPVVPKRLQYILGSVDYICNTAIYNQGVYLDFYQADPLYGAQDRGQSIHVYMVTDENTTIGGVAFDITDPNIIYPFLAFNLNSWVGYKAAWNNGLNGGTGHVINHEVGHLLGLYHDNGGDDCADTGEHPNCYSYDPNDPVCGNWANISNNVMMSAGLPWQEALTPCQIDRIQTRLLGNLSSYVEQCVQECSPASPSFTLTNNIICSRASQIVTIYPNNTANSTKWKVKVTKPNGQVFANAWQTGTIPSSINLNSTLGMNFSSVGNYTIILSADNSPSCPGEENWVESLTVLSSTDPQCRRGGGILRTAGSVVTPNPSQGSFSINYELTQASDISMMLIDPLGNLVKMLLPMGKQPVGAIQRDFQMNLQPGLYQILINENGVVEKFPLTIAR